MKFLTPDLAHRFLLLLLPLAVCLLYLNTLEVPFVFDDSQIFADDRMAAEDLSPAGLFRSATQGINKNRIVANLSFAINYGVNGVDVTGYHWVNIGVHAVAALVVYFLLRLVFSLCPGENQPRRYGEMAFLAALLWAVHPLQTNAVTYIIQRMTSLAALFYLLSLLLYIRARLRGTWAASWYLYVAALIVAVMALFSKENSAMLPVAVLGVELYFLRDRSPGSWSGSKTVLAGGLLVGGFVLISLLFLGTDPLARILDGYRYRNFTLGQRLLTEPRVIFSYLGLLILPLPSRLNIAHDYALSTGLLSPPQTLVALFGLLGLAVGITLLYRRYRLTSFALFWLLVNLLLESSIIPLMIIFEHRMYLPSIFLVGAGVVWSYRLVGDKTAYARWGLVCVAILFSLFSWQRNQVWQSRISLWQDVVNKSPALAWGRANLGKAYAEKGEYKLAEQELRRAIALDSASGLGYLNLGVMYEKQDRLYEANLALNKALERKVGDPAQLFVNLAVVNFRLGNYETALQYGERALSLRPGRYKVYDILGTTSLKTGRYAEAERVFQRALELFPQKGTLYVRMAQVLEKQNRLKQAENMLNLALKLRDVKLADVYNQLGIVYWRMHRLPESIQAAAKALEIEPDLQDAYLTLGISYEDAGQQEMAFSQFKKGWQKGLDMVTLYNSWADHHMQQNNPDQAILYLKQALNLEPGRAGSHRNLARAYAMKGMKAEAEAEENAARRLSR